MANQKTTIAGRQASRTQQKAARLRSAPRIPNRASGEDDHFHWNVATRANRVTMRMSSGMNESLPAPGTMSTVGGLQRGGITSTFLS